MTQGWCWRPAQPALGLALVLTSCQFCLVFKVKPEKNLPDGKNYQGNRGNLEVGLALENLPEPPLYPTLQWWRSWIYATEVTKAAIEKSPWRRDQNLNKIKELLWNINLTMLYKKIKWGSVEFFFHASVCCIVITKKTRRLGIFSASEFEL